MKKLKTRTMSNSKSFNINIYKYIVLVALFVVMGQNNKVYAQIDDEIKVIAPYEPTISDAVKISQNPKISFSVEKTESLSYTIISKQLDTDFKVEELKPAKMAAEPLEKLYKGHTKIGYGLYNTFLFEGYYNTLRSREKYYGVQYRHLSSKGGLPDVGKDAYSDNMILANAKRMFDKSSVEGSVLFDRKVRHYYGYNPELFPDTITDESQRQRFSLFELNGSHYSVKNRKDQINHKLSFKYYNYSDLFLAKENNLMIAGNATKDFNYFNAFSKELIKVDAGINFFHLNNKNISNGNSIIHIKPSVYLRNNTFSIEAGLNTFFTLDTVSYSYFKPTVEGNVFLIDKILTAYTGIRNDVKKNSYRSLTEENPFAIPTISTDFSIHKFDFYAGVKGSISSVLSYDVGISNAKIDNMHFFITDTSTVLDNKFTLVYDDVRLLKIYGSLYLQIKEKIKMILIANYYEHTMSNEEKPWHKPNFDLTLGFDYNIQEKIMLNFDVIVYGESYDRYTIETLSGQEYDKNLGIVDLNAGIEYRLTNIWSAFIRLSNIEGNSHYRWNHYPSQKFHFLGGISFTF